MQPAMATCMTLFLLLVLALTSATEATDNSPSKGHDLDVAIEQMTTANYFTFVTLINMSPLDDRIQENVTFLMPNDRILSKTRIPQNSVLEFLLRHSIPTPLLFDQLQLIPSGSAIPSCDHEYILDINNNGRRSFFLNNVKIISPNICTAGSIRCHGIDGVLTPIKNALPSCSNTSIPPVAVAPPPPGPSSNTSNPPVAVASPPPAPSLAPAAPPLHHPTQEIPVVTAPLPVQHASPKKSGTTMSDEGSLKFSVPFVLMSIIGLNM